MRSNPAWETIIPSPYQDLFIYYLEGRLSTEVEYFHRQLGRREFQLSFFL